MCLAVYLENGLPTVGIQEPDAEPSATPRDEFDYVDPRLQLIEDMKTHDLGAMESQDTGMQEDDDEEVEDEVSDGELDQVGLG
jgi:hypothetical protein